MHIHYYEVYAEGFVFNCGALSLGDYKGTTMTVRLCLYENSNYMDPDNYTGGRIAMEPQIWEIDVPNQDNLITAQIVMGIMENHS